MSITAPAPTPQRPRLTAPALVAVAPAAPPLWHQLARSDSEALACQTPAWVAALCRGGDYEDASRGYEFDDGLRAVLPLVRRRGPWPRALAPLASMPNAWGMGGLLADRPLGHAHVAAVARDLSGLHALRTTVRPNPLHAELWGTPPGAIAIARRAHVLDLAGGPDEVWKNRFRSAARRGVRKAEKAGLQIECGNSDRLIDAFHRLLGVSIERWADLQNEPHALARWRGRRRDPRAKFAHLADTLGDALRIWVAFRDGEPAAALVVLIGRDASYTRGAMDKELAGPVAANDLLHWLAIIDACDAGCARYHMGETGQSTALARYKEKLGARPHDYAELRFERLPLTRADATARRVVKRVLRFRDA